MGLLVTRVRVEDDASVEAVAAQNAYKIVTQAGDEPGHSPAPRCMGLLVTRMRVEDDASAAAAAALAGWRPVWLVVMGAVTGGLGCACEQQCAILVVTESGCNGCEG